jgi:hypothetical protein
VGIDGHLEALGVAKAARRLLHPLDDSIDALEAGIGATMTQLVRSVGRQVTLNQLGDRRDRLEEAMGGPPVPAAEEGLGGAGMPVLQKVGKRSLKTQARPTSRSSRCRVRSAVPWASVMSSGRRSHRYLELGSRSSAARVRARCSPRQIRSTASCRCLTTWNLSALHQNVDSPVRGRGGWNEGGRGRDPRMVDDTATIVEAREAQARRVSGLGGQGLGSRIGEY